MNAFAAEPGTTLLLATLYLGELEVREYPVLGWTNIQGRLCFPLLPLNPLTSPSVPSFEAIDHPAGVVTEAASQAVFGSREEWSADAFKRLKEIDAGKESRDKALSEKRVAPMIAGPDADEADQAEAEAAMAALRKSGTIEPATDEKAPAEPVQAAPEPAKGKRTRKPAKATPAPAQGEDDDIAGML